MNTFELINSRIEEIFVVTLYNYINCERERERGLLVLYKKEKCLLCNQNWNGISVSRMQISPDIIAKDIGKQQAKTL